MEAAELSGRFALQSFQFQQKGPLPVPERLRRLRLLEKAVESHIDDIAAALRADLGKSPAESYETETGIVLSELRFALRRLRHGAETGAVLVVAGEIGEKIAQGKKRQLFQLPRALVADAAQSAHAGVESKCGLHAR